MKLQLKYIFPPIVFILIGCLLNFFISDKYQVTQIIEVGKFSGTYIIQPEELIMDLKNVEFQKKIYQYVDENSDLSLVDSMKILSAARVYRSKHIGITAEAKTVEQASKTSEQLSNAIAFYTNLILSQKIKFIKQQSSYLDKNMEVTNQLLQNCETNIKCREGNLNLNLTHYLNQISKTRNDIELSIASNNTYPTKIAPKLKEIRNKSSEFNVLIVLVFLSLGISCSLLLFIKQEP